MPKTSSSYPNFDEQYLLRTVRRNYSVPDNGGPKELAKYDNCRVFVWKFEQVSTCSQVTKDDVKLTTSKKLIEGEPTSGGKISYPYFTLKYDLKPHVNDTFLGKKYESERVDTFSTSLQNEWHIVHYIEKIQSHYCEFSGGGDIYIENNVEEPLLFTMRHLRGKPKFKWPN